MLPSNFFFREGKGSLLLQFQCIIFLSLLMTRGGIVLQLQEQQWKYDTHSFIIIFRSKYYTNNWSKITNKCTSYFLFLVPSCNIAVHCSIMVWVHSYGSNEGDNTFFHPVVTKVEIWPIFILTLKWHFSIKSGETLTVWDQSCEILRCPSFKKNNSYNVQSLITLTHHLYL